MNSHRIQYVLGMALVCACPRQLQEQPPPVAVADAGVPSSTLASPQGRPAGFAFESRQDDVGRALASVTASMVTAPRDQASFDAWRTAEAAALDVVQAHPDETVQAIRAELAVLSEDDLRGHVLCVRVLAVLDNALAIEILKDLALRPVPALPDTAELAELSPHQVVRLVRLQAVDALGGLLARGSGAARTTTLQLLTNAEPEVKVRAVEAIYSGSAVDWRAREEMVAYLPREDRHLLHQAQ